MNSLQKDKKVQIDAVIAEERAFEIDQVKDEDPLRAAMMTEAYGIK